MIPIQKILSSILLFLVLSMTAQAQLYFPSYNENMMPDYGTRVGEAGVWQVSRPYGNEGFILNNWNQALDLAPSGYSRQLAYFAGTLKYSSKHMSLDVPLSTLEDTVATWIDLNYKQGDYDIMNLGIWYHTALSNNQTYGQLHEVRKFPHYVGGSAYSVEDHRVQWTIYEHLRNIRLTAQFHKTVLPFNDFAYDTLGLTGLAKSTVYQHTYASGGVQINDTTQAWLYQFELWQRLGNREWKNNKSLEGRTIALLSLKNKHYPLKVLVGGMQFKTNSTRLAYPVLDAHYTLKIPFLDVSILGFKSLYHNEYELSPDINLAKSWSKLHIKFMALPLLQSDISKEEAHLSTVYSFASNYRYMKNNTIALQFWQTSTNARGWQGRFNIDTKSNFSLKLQFDQLIDSPANTYIYAHKKLSWSAYWPFQIRSGAMLVLPGLQGEHYFHVNSGVFDGETLRVESSPFVFEHNALHRIHANITAVVKTVSINYTNYNSNYDPLLTNISSLNLPQTFLTFANTSAEGSFHVLTVTWALMD